MEEKLRAENEAKALIQQAQDRTRQEGALELAQVKEQLITNTVGMYGEMSGILGGSLPEIPALSLDGVAGLLES